MTFLLDVNVLVALVDTSHVHHEAAHRWFASTGLASWATCPLTENGFVRILSNPAYKGGARRPYKAAEQLRILCELAGHVFWADSISIFDKSHFELSRLQGHQQITDVYLAALAAANGGKVASFDANIPIHALCNLSQTVLEVIPRA